MFTVNALTNLPMSYQQSHVALAAFTPAFYRWEIQRMWSIMTPGEMGAYMEPDVGQEEEADSLLTDGEVIVDGPVWSLYGRHFTGEVEHITDFQTLQDAIDLARSLGASAMFVLPGPVSQCRGRQVVFENDDTAWGDDRRTNIRRVVGGIRRHLEDVVRNYTDALNRILPTVDGRYASQEMLDKL